MGRTGTQQDVTRAGDPVHAVRVRRPRAVALLLLVLLAAGAGAGTRLAQSGQDGETPAPKSAHAQPRGDVDGDGRADLLLSTDAEIRAYTSTGTSFVASGLAAESAEDVVRGDVDGDGRTDLVSLVPARDVIDVVLRLAGDGSFLPAQRFRVEGVGRGDRVVLGDVDGDGDDDLVGTGSAGVVVARADSQAFRDAEVWADPLTLGEHAFVLAGQFTDDGRADLLVVDGDAEHVLLRVLPGTGDGFGEPELWREVPGWRIGLLRPAVGDFDGDGRTDVAELGEPLEGGADVMVLRSRGVDFAPPRQWLLEEELDWQGTRLVTGDYDGDGTADAATVEPQADGTTAVVVRRSNGAGFREPMSWLTGEWPGSARPVGVGAGVVGIR